MGTGDEKKLSWKHYARLVNEYLAMVETVVWPDLIIIIGAATWNNRGHL